MSTLARQSVRLLVLAAFAASWACLRVHQSQHRLGSADDPGPACSCATAAQADLPGEPLAALEAATPSARAIDPPSDVPVRRPAPWVRLARAPPWIS